MQMHFINGAISAVASMSSSNAKKLLLRRYGEEVSGFKEVLRFIYNPYIKTGISTAKLDLVRRTANNLLPLPVQYDYDSIIRYLLHNPTGRDVDLTQCARFINSIKMQDPGAVPLAEAIITKNLKIGVTATTLNEVYGKGFIPRTGCMLGTLYSDVPAAKVAWPCIVTEKLDGIRRMLLKKDGKVTCYSRSGIEDTGLVDIIREAEQCLPDNMMYDGELLAIGSFKDSIALRQATCSIANSKGTKTGLSFNVFDMVPLDEYKEGVSNSIALSRKARLAATFDDETLCLLPLGASSDPQQARIAYRMDPMPTCIRVVPILGTVKTFAEIEPIVAAIWEAGGEGVMLNTVKGLYEVKRSKQLLKVKHTEEHVLPVVDFLEGTGKFEGTLGALVVEYKGNRLGVGSGLSDAQRLNIWQNQEALKGRCIEIDTFGESKNALGSLSLNCPIFKRFVGDE